MTVGVRIVCIERRRSLIAAAFGRIVDSLGNLNSSIDGMASNPGCDVRVGEAVGVESSVVIMVRWPDDIYEKRLDPSLRLSNCSSACETTLLLTERSLAFGVKRGS